MNSLKTSSELWGNGWHQTCGLNVDLMFAGHWSIRRRRMPGVNPAASNRLANLRGYQETGQSRERENHRGLSHFQKLPN
jgi:hypothetical protein